MGLRVVLAVGYAALLLVGCSRSNNLLFGRVEAVVAGHTVVVTDCYRTKVPAPVPESNGATFTPCRDAAVVIRNEQRPSMERPTGHSPPAHGLSSTTAASRSRNLRALSP